MTYIIRYIILCLFCFLSLNKSYSQEKIEPDSLFIAEDIDTQIKTITNDVYALPYSLWDNRPNYKRLGQNTLLMYGSTFLASGILYMMPESISNWDKESMSLNSVFSDWWKNVSAGPVVDKDDLFLNYITHPYCGAIYYMGGRSAGLNAPYAFLYSFVLSTFFWEYGVEAFAEVPSVQDLIITPVIGSLLGEAFYLAKRGIVANDYQLLNSKALGHSAIFLMDPLNEVVDLFGGKSKKDKNKSSVSLSSYPTISPTGGISYQVSLNVAF